MRQIGTLEAPGRRYRDGSTDDERRAHIDKLLTKETTARLVCPDCQGLVLSCRTCDGYGMVCPTCRGLHFVRVARAHEGDDYVSRPPYPCPSCCGADGKFNVHLLADAIRGVLIKAGIR